MAKKRVLVLADDGGLLGYANIDPDKPLTRGETSSGAFALYLTNSGSFIVTWDDSRYSQYARGEVVDLLVEAGKVDLLVSMEMIREL